MADNLKALPIIQVQSFFVQLLKRVQVNQLMFNKRKVEKV
jgi:hypothetical protein